MNTVPILGNLLAWMEQVLVIGSVGCLLLLLLQIRHPRTQLPFSIQAPLPEDMLRFIQQHEYAE